MRKVVILSLVCLGLILSINYVIGSINTNSKSEGSISSLESLPGQLSDIRVLVYPNPLTEERLTIESNTAIVEIEILDIVGKSRFREKFEGGVSRTSISFKEYTTGLYILKITFEGNKFYTEKVLLK